MTLATGVVLPRWLGAATMFPLFGTLFVNTGGLAPEARERYGNVMRVFLLTSLAALGLGALLFGLLPGGSVSGPP